MVGWENTRTLTFMIDEVKAEYVKWIKKVCIDDIFKPVIPNQNFPSPKKLVEKHLTLAQVSLFFFVI